LAIPFDRYAHGDYRLSLRVPWVPFTEDYLGSMKNDALEMMEFPGPKWFYPGRSLSLGQDNWVKLASLGPYIPSLARKRVGSMLDSDIRDMSPGHLARHPGKLFYGFEIMIDHSQYTLELFGVARDNSRKLLYTTRVGLGSREYPTPTGSYWLVRIFDKNPLWIPPNRMWAWGQSPSRSVYGGHMMPLFVKRPLKGSRNRAVPDQGLDRVAPKMKVIDSQGYRVHGTSSPWSVGGNQSHGCVRMLNSTVKQLADTLKLYAGTTTRSENANGEYVNLARPVRLFLRR